MESINPKPQPSCDHVLQRLTAFLDNETRPAEHDAIARHLTRCEGCRAERDRIAVLCAELGQTTTPIAPAGLSGKIMRRIQEEGTAASRIKSFRLLPVSAAVAVLGLLIGGWMARTVLDTDTHGEGEQGLIAAMDIFAPNPRGTFIHGYLATLENPGRH